MTLKLYDLAGADPQRRFSPYCWRIRLALAHKGLAVETIPWRFVDKAAIAQSGQGRVPVLVDGDHWIADSWAIAIYLEETYPDRPSLFGGAGPAPSRFYSAYADDLVARIAPFVLRDILDHLDEGDRDYFRTSREKRLGATLEAFVADREARAPAFRAGLAPLRATLRDQPFFGGERPMYADYSLFGPLQWARCISPFQILAPDDPVAAWRGRMLDLFGGLARSAPGYDLPEAG
jgi:glutathione S-transferase